MLAEIAYVCGVAGVVLIAFSLLDWEHQRDSYQWWLDREARRRNEWEEDLFR